MSYTDITASFQSAWGKLAPGQIVAGPNFSYLESMSAVELMDPKLDSGRALLGSPSLDSIISSYSLPGPSELSEGKYVYFCKEILRRLGLWLEGQSVTHTFYGCIYYYVPEYAEDTVIKHILAAITCVVEDFHAIVCSSSCLRDDDYAFAPVKLWEWVRNKEVAEKGLIASEKCNTNEFILSCLRFWRAFLDIMHELIKPNLEGFNQAKQHFDLINQQIEFLKTASVTEEVFTCFDEKLTLRILPHFLPNKLKDSELYTYEKALTKISHCIHNFETICSPDPCRDLDTLWSTIRCLGRADILTRVLADVSLFPNSENRSLVLNSVPMSQLITQSMSSYGINIEEYKKCGQFNEYIVRVEIVFKELTSLNLKNNTRIRRNIWKYFMDLNILLNEADYVEAALIGSRNGIKHHLFHWMFGFTLLHATRYLELGCILNLYSMSEIGMVFFYLDYLYGVLHTNKQNLFNILNTKTGKKNKKKTKALLKIEEEIKFANALQLLSRGVVRLHLVLSHKGLIPKLQPELEEARFNKRFRALSILQVPNMLEYSSYRTIKELPKEVEMDRLITACAECFDAARGALSDLEKTRYVKPLLRVCVRNSLVVSMGRKMNWECGIKLEYTEHESYPVFVVGPKS